MGFLLSFSRNDLKNVTRDSLLRYMLIIPLLIAPLLRIIVPRGRAWLAVGYQINLESYYPLILSFIVFLQVPLIFGVIFGLLLLDERDDGMFPALAVTPASINTYIVYRTLMAWLLSILYVIILLPASGLLGDTRIGELLPAIFLAGLMAVMLMLVLVVQARNKLEGLALMKGMGILLLGPLAAYFIQSKWQVLLGILPSYWPAKAFWLISQGEHPWLYLGLGFIYNLLIIMALAYRFKKRIGIG